jgi:hypothetical protein
MLVSLRESRRRRMHVNQVRGVLCCASCSSPRAVPLLGLLQGRDALCQVALIDPITLI